MKMNKQHTKEPWYTAYRENGAGMYSQDIFDSYGKTIADVAWYPIKDDNKTYTNGEENAKRIVACVNACKGIPQETLEQKYLFSLKTEKKILFDKVKDAVLHCFKKTEDRESDHQCYNGEWYIPVCGCDTLQDIIDSIEQEIIG